MTDAKPTLLAIYDMDKTVTRRATYNGFLLHMAFNKSPWRLFLSPLLSLGLRLGEGSGAALALGVIKGALACHSGMSTFAEAGVSAG